MRWGDGTREELARKRLYVCGLSSVRREFKLVFFYEILILNLTLFSILFIPIST